MLRSMGHDVVEVVTVDARMDDEEILRWAQTEMRIIITTDQDFEEMIWREQKTHCGLLRLENLPRSARKQLLVETLATYSTDLETGAIVIATTRKTRVRRPFR